MTHNKVDASEIVAQAESERSSIESNLRAAADWFHDYYDNEGDMLERKAAVKQVEQHLDVEKDVAARIVANLVGDIVDPITQVNTLENKYVGIIDYNEGDIYYSYTEHDDSVGEREVVVCAQCVHEHEHEANVTHAKEYSGSFEEASHADLVQAVREHFDEAHDESPEDVETGASLLSGTTIAGNSAWHAGNDGSGSALDAALFKGNDLDSDGDGDVDRADVATDADALGGTTASEFNTFDVTTVNGSAGDQSTDTNNTGVTMENVISIFVYDDENPADEVTYGDGNGEITYETYENGSGNLAVDAVGQTEFHTIKIVILHT